MNIVEKLLDFNPFKKNYNKMVHKICIEVAENKLTATIFSLSQEERDNLLLEMQKDKLSTKSD